jgi:predicted nucleic acid-binding Zn ribbon protein
LDVDAAETVEDGINVPANDPGVSENSFNLLNYKIQSQKRSALTISIVFILIIIKLVRENPFINITHSFK